MGSDDDNKDAVSSKDFATSTQRSEVQEVAEENAVEIQSFILTQLHQQVESITWWRRIVIVVAIFWPLVTWVHLLLVFSIVRFFNPNDTVQVVMISGSLLTYVVVFSFLLKGVFASPGDTGKVEETLSKVLDILAKLKK